ncbi:hypothetical protein FPZ61_14550 [Synechococcus sp. BSA11S]|uniref:hypothetical protein n=1 Tax=Synechococcales TaxID=1890424 RepID=UPI0016232E76|nr:MULTISPECIES: hypothetical protein [unclassified Synechococcus]MBC1265335.1 hypothetical protein [Synechococcus sp. BSA11S]
MIIAESFLWLHLPKTGGTTMNRLFRSLALPAVEVDADSDRAKHDSVTLRESRGSWRAGDRRRFISSRRLSSWLLSDWRHKRRHMGLPDLPLEPVRSGLFYSLRLGGVWVAADWWLRYFDPGDSVTTLRLEHLAEDLNRHLLPLLPSAGAQLLEGILPRENARPANSPSGSGPAESVPFSAEDLARQRCVNPLWAEWEQRVYGP